MRLAIVARRAIDCADTGASGISKAARHPGIRAVHSIGPQYLVRTPCGRLSPQSRDTAKRALRDQFVRGNCSHGGSRPRCVTPARPGAAMAGGLVARQTTGTGPFLHQSHRPHMGQVFASASISARIPGTGGGGTRAETHTEKSQSESARPAMMFSKVRRQRTRESRRRAVCWGLRNT